MKLSKPSNTVKLSSYALTQAKQAANLLAILTSPAGSFNRDPMAILKAA